MKHEETDLVRWGPMTDKEEIILAKDFCSANVRPLIRGGLNGPHSTSSACCKASKSFDRARVICSKDNKCRSEPAH